MFIKVSQVSGLEQNKPTHIEVEGVDLVLLGTGSKISLFESRCPHQGAFLHEGAVRNGALVCRAHGWAFDADTGVCRGKQDIALTSIPLRIEGDDILADSDAVRDLADRRKMEGRSSETVASVIQSQRTINDLPGPVGLPVLGNAHQINLEQLHVTMENWHEQYGPFFKFRILRQNAIAVAHPHLIRMVLRERPHNFRRISSIESVFQEMHAQGLFSVEKEEWRYQRRIVAQALNARQIRLFFPKMQQITERLMRRWSRASEDGRVVDVQEDLMRYTVDVTSNLSFNYDMNTVEKEGDVIQDHLEHVFPMISRRVNSAVPYWRYFKFQRDRDLDKALVALKGIIDDIIDKSRDRLKQNGGNVEAGNLVEAMLQLQETEGTITNDAIFGNIFSLLIAGEDTTANTMVWILHFLSSRPEVFKRMQEEADEVLGGSDVLPDLETANRLIYHDAVINEALRLKPVASIWPMEACSDVVMDGVAVPAGTPVFLLTRIPTLVDENGAPAPEFDPERWLRKDASTTHFDNVMVPFGAGPRLCPGRSLSLLEIRAVMSMVSRRFELELPTDGPSVGERFAFTLIPTNVRLRFKERNKYPAGPQFIAPTAESARLGA